MSGASHRLLQLLGLFERQSIWTADALARALSVTTRTVRRDITRLRQLGYPVESELGPGGGYSLSTSVALPPLLFDTDEAVTVLLALREAELHQATASVASSASVKLRRAVPTSLQASTAGLETHVSDMRLGRMIGAVPRPADLGQIALLARACRERRQVTCDSTGDDTDGGRMCLEPHHVFRAMDRWYVLARETGTGRWLTLAVDKLTQLALSSAHATRPAFDGDAQEHVADHVRRGIQRVSATVRIHAPASAVTAWVEPAWGVLRPETDTTTIVECGADTFDAIARWLLLIGADITVIEPGELRHAFARVAETASKAAQGPCLPRVTPDTRQADPGLHAQEAPGAGGGRPDGHDGSGLGEPLDGS